MVNFQGERDFPQPLAELWEKLTDARFLLQCIPGVEAVSVAEADSAAWKLRPGVSFVRGTLETTLRILRGDDNSARYLVHSKGIGSSSSVEATVRFTPLGKGTHIHWTAEIKELGGLLKAVPRGLIQASAQKVIADAWVAVDGQLGKGATGPAPAPG